jgi:peptidoglycan/LPS O-acetylase OafA/YrhL
MGSGAAPRPWEQPPVPDRGYRRGLDGLRAIAIIGVLLYHAGVGWVPGGLLGVDLFFVVSGFLITSLLIAELESTGRISPAAFYRRRALRLLPALAVVLFFTAAALVTFWPREVAHFRGDLVASFGYVTNWWFILRHQSYFIATGRPSPFQHLWSLAVEEQFYLLWPLAMVVFAGLLRTRRGLIRLGVLAIGGACASAGLMALVAVRQNLPYGADSSRVYFGTDTHAFSLLIGVAAAAVLAAGAGPLWQRRPGPRATQALNYGGLAALAVVCWAMLRTSEFSPGLYRGGFWAFAVVAGVVVVAASRPGSRLESLLGGKALRWIGTRSYSLYLWHWPVFVFTRPQLDLPLAGTADLVLRLVLVTALAEASYRLVEQPIRTVGPKLWLGALLLKLSDTGESLQSGGSRLRRSWATGRQTRREAPQASIAPTAPTPATAAAARGPVVGPGPVVAPVPSTESGGRTIPAGQWFVAASVLLSILLLAIGGEHRAATRANWQTPFAYQLAARIAVPSPSKNAPEKNPAKDPAKSPGKDAAPVTQATATPAPSASPAAPPAPAPRTYTVIGDSVMRGALDALKAALPGADIDAVEGRQASVAFDIIDTLAGKDHVGSDVVLHIGTNGTIEPSALDAVLARLGRRRVVVLTDHVPRPWQDLNNRILTEAAHNRPNVHLVDWNAAASAHPGWLWPDGIHLRPEGAAAYRDLIVEALK